jgi:predicted amidohydrolase YtcJ
MTEIGSKLSALRNVRIVGGERDFLAEDELVDIHLEDGVIVDIAPTGNLTVKGESLDGEGSWVIPGLWDNHVHTVQWSLSAQRESLLGAGSAAAAIDIMRNAPMLPDGKRVGTGFRDAGWADKATLAALDAATGEVPTYLINADLHSVWLNSAALRKEGFYEIADDGVLREEEAFEISRRLNAVDPSQSDAAVFEAARKAAARGITGLVDFDMAWNKDAWIRRLAAGFDVHRVEYAVYPMHLDRAIAEGLRTGEELPGGLVQFGYFKVITDGSLGTRTAACSHPYPDDNGNFGMLTVSNEELVDMLMRATGAGIAAAVHTIGDHAGTSALDAIAQTGATGTIEHAQLMQQADIVRMARMGLIASIQPQHALDDRDLVAKYWSEQTAIAYPMETMRRAGVQLRLGSDAPVAPLDPWTSIAAAVMRTDDEREPWQPQERLSVDDAIGASVRSTINPGQRADIAMLAHNPRHAAAATLRAMPVHATLLAGSVTHLA